MLYEIQDTSEKAGLYNFLTYFTGKMPHDEHFTYQIPTPVPCIKP